MWPSFNSSQKKPEELFGIFVYEDQNGYMRLAIEKKRKNSYPIYTFHYKVDGHGVIRKLMKEFSLTQPTLSHHFNKLVDAGIITNRKEGVLWFYSINKQFLKEKGIDLKKLLEKHTI